MLEHSVVFGFISPLTKNVTTKIGSSHICGSDDCEIEIRDTRYKERYVDRSSHVENVLNRGVFLG